MNTIKLLFILACFLSGIFNLQAQLFVDNDYTAEEMVMEFFDQNCASISNVTSTGSDEAFGFFDAGNINIGINAGIILCTGAIETAIGPNDNGGNTLSIGNLEGDEDLDKLIPASSTQDAMVIEFDLVPEVETFDFQYIFGSEEYLEYVNSSFNDVFAFYISGPGFDSLTNIALIPDSNIPVTINNVNHLENTDYFVDNEALGGNDLQFDGFTTVLSAPITVVPYETYHIKLAIADGGDHILDSGVLISIESMCGGSSLASRSGFNEIRDGKKVTFEDESRFASSWYWDFGDGDTSTERSPEHIYAADGIYTVTQTVKNFCCEDTKTFDIQIGEQTAIEERGSDENFLLYPNPSNGTIYIQQHNTMNFSGSSQITLYDIAGQSLQVFRMEGKEFKMDLSRFGKGVFFIKIENKEGSYTERLVYY